MRYIVLFLILAACTPEQASKLRNFGDTLQGHQDEISECKNLGFKEESESFSNCRLQIRAMNEQKDNAQKHSTFCQKDVMGNYSCY